MDLRSHGSLKEVCCRAQGDKLHVGDRIIAVGGIPVVGMEITEAVEYIRGPQGTTALLTVLRGEEKLDIDITRER